MPPALLPSDHGGDRPLLAVTDPTAPRSTRRSEPSLRQLIGGREYGDGPSAPASGIGADVSDHDGAPRGRDRGEAARGVPSAENRAMSLPVRAGRKSTGPDRRHRRLGRATVSPSTRARPGRAAQGFPAHGSRRAVTLALDGIVQVARRCRRGFPFGAGRMVAPGRGRSSRGRSSRGRSSMGRSGRPAAVTWACFRPAGPPWPVRSSLRFPARWGRSSQRCPGPSPRYRRGCAGPVPLFPMTG